MKVDVMESGLVIGTDANGYLWFGHTKPATIGTAMEPMDPLDRKLADLTERIARLERRDVQGSADLSAALALLGRALVILGHMMQGEDNGTRR